jgi:hypothetical protein
MKKHPVDELFAKKLTEWEPRASSDLWKKIEARQAKPTRRLGGGYWFAAAGVSIALLSGYLVWQGKSTQPHTTGTEIARQEPAIMPQKEVEKLTIPADGAELMARVETSDPKNGSAGETSPAPEKTGVVMEENKATQQQESVRTLDEVEIAAIPRGEIKPETEIAGNDKLASTPAVEIPSVTKSEEPSKTRVIIAHIPTEGEASQDDQKSSKLIHILRQLKNAKEGEAVDWDVVGFNPKKLMARADQRLKTEEEKLSKQYQNLKEKTKL